MNLRKFQAAVLILACAASSQAAPLAFSDPKNEIFRFGKAGKVNPVVHSFTVENKGDEPLKLAVGVHCACTTISLHPEVIAPGAKGEVHFSMDPKDLYGSVNKHAVVTTNDSKHPELHFTFTGYVESDLTFLPTQISLNEIDQAAVLSEIHSAVFYSKTKKFKIEKIESAPGIEVKAEALPTTPGYLLWIRFSKVPSVGALQSEIVIFTDHEESPSKVALGGVIRGRIRINPPVIGFRPETLDKPQYVRISWEGKDVNIGEIMPQSIDPRSADIIHELKRVPGENAYILQVQPRNSTAPVVRNTFIELKTDDELNKVLHIPIVFLGTPDKK